jgi:diguanylate cyclase
MIIIITLFILAFCIFLLMGFYVFLLNPKNKVNITFFIITIFFALISYSTTLMQISVNESRVIFLSRIVTSATSFIYTLLILFAVYISGLIKVKKIYYPLLFIFPIFSTYRNFIIPEFLHVEKINDIWVLIDIGEKFNFYLVIGYWLLCAVIFSTIMIIWMFKTKLFRERKQALILLVSVFVTTFATVLWVVRYDVFNFIFKARIYDAVCDNYLFSLMFIAGIAYCIVKYRFLSITPEYVSKEILSNIDESIVLLDTNQKIISINTKAALLTNNTKIKEGTDLSDAISGYPVIEKDLSRLLKGEIKSFSTQLYFLNGNDNIYMNIKFSVVKDKFEDILGVLIIGKEIKEFKHFIEQFKITERQFEIIKMKIDGLSNDEICEKLCLARRTIESHLSNIYNKLSVKNKIELIKLANEYNLLIKN